MDTKPENPDEIRLWLSNACTAVYEGLLLGTYKVQEYFEGLSHDLNKPLAANIARYHAKHYVKSQRRLDAPYYLAEPPNNGIEIRQDWCEIKVLKGHDGHPPTASNTLRSHRFYHQQHIQPSLPGIRWTTIWKAADWPAFIKSCTKLNLILCWEVDYDYSISRMQLVCPRASGKYGEGVKTFWRLDVPHPVLGILNLESVDESQEVDDLPIYFEDAAEQGDDD